MQTRTGFQIISFQLIPGSRFGSYSMTYARRLFGTVAHIGAMMSDLADAVAITLEELETHEPHDAALAERLATARTVREDLQLHLDSAVN